MDGLRQDRVGEQPAPVFIVGMNGSGTTMMLDCLNNHPEFYGLPIETKVLPMFFQRLDRYGDLTVDENYLRLWNDLRNMVFFRWVNGRRPVPLPEDWAANERSFAGVLDAILRYFAQREGKRRWCEKSPMYALHMPAFAAMYPRASFIHMIRDGRDCANSFQRRYGYTPERTMLRWRSVVRKARELGRDLGPRYLEMRYEDLTSSPEANMSRICSFLEVPYTPAVLQLSHRRRRDKMVARRIVANAGRWRNSLDPPVVRNLERIGGRMLHELGYQTDRPDSEWTPSWPLRAYWGRKDDLTSLARELRRIAGADNWRHRRVLVEKLVTHVRNKAVRPDHG